MKKTDEVMEERFRGAIPLLRKFREHPFWAEERKFSRAEAFIDLLYMAHYSETPSEIIDRGEEIIIPYAHILTSIVTLSERWKKSRQWVRTFFNYLEKHKTIRIVEKNNRRTIIEIVNMRKIQKTLQQSGQEKLQQQLQQNLQQKDHRNTHNNKDNTLNKENNSTNIGQNKNENKKTDEPHLQRIGDVLRNKFLSNDKNTSIATPHQEQALRYAKSLQIDLKHPTVVAEHLDSRWIGLFKNPPKDFNKKLPLIYSQLSDYKRFNGLDAAAKIKYFFKCLYNKT